MTTSGTKEWADSNVNIYHGCSNDCKYCYAKGMAIRFKRKTNDSWKDMELNERSLFKNYRKRKGRIMFPSSHDITFETFNNCLTVLKKLLKAGNQVLITTKPQYSIIEGLCHELSEYKDLVQFRFTITSFDPLMSEYWEPGATSPLTRIMCLAYAKNKGFKTSVSIEPFLDYWHDMKKLLKMIDEHITESIWIGPMNRKFCPPKLWNELLWGKDYLHFLYICLKDHPKVRFKDSFISKITYTTK